MNTMLLRKWHGYLGAFIAPSVIFFALTGSLQMFNLHESHDGYRPAPLVEKLARVHKDQVFAVDHDRGPPPGDVRKPADADGPKVHDDDDRPSVPTFLLKLFFLLVALGLVVSTTLGLWIGLTRPHARTATIALMAAGCALPLLLLII